MTVALSLYVFPLFSIVLTFQDSTLDWNQNSERMVDAVVNKLDTSCLFDSSKLMLQRLAYVQSLHGHGKLANETHVYDGGIWRITRSQFDELKQGLDETTVEDVFNQYRVDLARLGYEDLNRPFYSGLVQALYLKHLTGKKFEYLPSELNAQAELFAKFIRTDNYTYNRELYKSRVHMLQSAVCEKKKPIDLIILIGESSRMKISDFEMLKMFLVNLLRNIDIGGMPSNSRVSLVFFNGHLAYQFNDTQNNLLIEETIFNLEFSPDNRVPTSVGLDLLSREIESHRRPNVPCVGLFVTDGPSANQTATLKAAQNLHKNHIGLFVISIGNPKNNDQDELDEIASVPHCQYLYLLNSFSELEFLSEFLSKKLIESKAFFPKIAQSVAAPMVFLVLRSQYEIEKFSIAGAFDMSTLLSNTDEYNFDLILTSSGTNLEIHNRDCSKRIEFFYSLRTSKPNEIYNDKQHLIDCKAPFRVRVQPYDKHRSRLFGMIRINADEISRSLEKRQADFDEDEEDGIEQLQVIQKKDCSSSGSRLLKHMVSVPVWIKVEGGEPCERGLYGVKCNKKCNCRGNVACESSTGECPNCACLSGYYGPACQTKCPPNTYSFMCSKKCHCKNNVQCDDITGLCPRRECADGWTGDDCQSFTCYGKNKNYFPDEDFCDKFYYCQTNRLGEIAHHITCPSGLFWERNTNTCKPENELITRCVKGSSIPNQFVKFNLEANSDFAQIQYDIYQLYKSLTVDDQNGDDEDLKSATPSNALRAIKNKFNYLICLKNIVGMHETSDDYKCPANVYNLTRIDHNARYQLMNIRSASRSQQGCGTYVSCMKHYNFGIYRHDVDNCLTSHQCEYSNDGMKLTHATFTLCNGSIFNQYLVKCITPLHARYYGLKSTMPNMRKRASCNQLVSVY